MVNVYRWGIRSIAIGSRCGVFYDSTQLPIDSCHHQHKDPIERQEREERENTEEQQHITAKKRNQLFGQEYCTCTSVVET